MSESNQHSTPAEIARELAHDDWTLEIGGEGMYAHPESVIGRTMRLARAYRDLQEQLEAAQEQLARPMYGPEGRWAELRGQRDEAVEQLEAAERALADAERIIESRTGKGSWVGSLVLARLRDSNPASEPEPS